MTGYTECLTDPSYAGQILVFTNPLIGNYGFEFHRMESDRVRVCGVVVSEVARVHSNPETRISLHAALLKAGVPGVAEVDTRFLTTLLRNKGSQNGLIAPASMPPAARMKRILHLPDMKGLDLSGRVTVRKALWHSNVKMLTSAPSVAVIDYGVKQNIIRELLRRGVSVRQMPAGVRALEVLDLNPAGVVLSNGPGDPAAMPAAVECIRNLIGRVPILGICLGHQLLGLAAGLSTYKLKFGHRGTNHPVQDLRKRTVAITTQNHGFSVRAPARIGRGVRITHVSLYDHTVEGIELPGRRAFGVQFHPESSPGPHDSLDLFDRFLAMCRR